MVDGVEIMLVVGLISVIFIASSFTAVYQHELAHQQIFEAYGIQSKIEWSTFKATTSPIDTNLQLNETDLKTMNALHSANEVYGYQITTIIIAITIYTLINISLTLMILKAKK